MTEVNSMGLEDAWHEVGKKKVTPKKEPLNNKTVSKSKSLRSKFASESSSRRNVKDSSGKSKPSDPVKVNGKVYAKKDALKSSSSGAASSQPQVVASSSNEHISIDSTQLDSKDASSHVIEGGGKKGYSSIVAALAERLPPEPLPVSSPISIYEFCMQCHDPAHWETPTSIPVTKPRGLINSKSDCFQNCILQALFALPTIRHLVNSFQSQPNLHEHLPLWSEFLSFGRRFLENGSETHHTDVTPSTYQARAHHRGGAHATASRTIPAQYKDSLLASSYMPRLSSLFARAEAAEGDAIADITSEVSIMNIGSKYAAQVNKSNNSNNNQQDAMEFLTFFFDALHEEVRQAWITSTSDEEQSIFDHWIRSLPYMQAMEQQLHGASSVRTDSSSSSSSTTWSVVQKPSRQQPVIPKSKIIQVDDASKQQAIREYASSSIIPRLFHGWLRSEVTYKAQRSCNITFQKFHCLTLSMQRDMATTASTGKPAVPMTMTLQSCLQNYFADERLENENMCKQTRFEILPEHLLLHVGRFSFDYRLNVPVKMHHIVEYPLFLTLPADTLSPGLLPPALDENEEVTMDLPTYKLRALVLHHGKKATGGHYTTVISNGEGSWQHCDDHRVASITEAQALQAGQLVYILFYERHRPELN